MFPPREWTFGNLTDYCSKRWGVTPKPDAIRTGFGGVHVGASTNIIWSNGLLGGSASRMTWAVSNGERRQHPSVSPSRSFSVLPSILGLRVRVNPRVSR
jgi:hypothetical protein